MIYDLAIMGGGPTGYSAALEASKYGISVVVFERELLGGTCLNKGCVPTKFLAHSAELYAMADKMYRYGISVAGVSINYSITNEQMHKCVKQLRDGLTALMERKKIKIVYGKAKAIDTNAVECRGELYRFKNLLIATGSKAAQPLVEGSGTSDQALQLIDIPTKVKILGGGVVAIEFANIFNKLGSEVTIAVRGERVLSKWDKEIAVGIAHSFKNRGIKILTKCVNDDFSVDGYDFVLSAVGRVPQIEGIEDLHLAYDEFNAIVTDNVGRTNLPHIYAAGDVISGSPMLAHIGMQQGKIVARYIAGEVNIKTSAVASCIYISPEVATIGITEFEAKENGIEILVGKQNMASNARTLIATDERCFIKIVVSKETHKILGAQLMCDRATDIASGFVFAINNGLTVEDLLSTAFPHPSFSETIVDVMEVILEKANEL